MSCIWLSVFFCWRVIYQFAKICKWQIGHPFVSLDGVSSSGDHPSFCLISWERRMQLRTSWFMLRVPLWCRKSQFRHEKTTFVHPINLIKKTSLLQGLSKLPKNAKNNICDFEMAFLSIKGTLSLRVLKPLITIDPYNDRCHAMNYCTGWQLQVYIKRHYQTTTQLNSNHCVFHFDMIFGPKTYGFFRKLLVSICLSLPWQSIPWILAYDISFECTWL